MAGSPTEAVVAVLKRALRQRGWRYRDLAGLLGLSESGIKKVFASGDLSLARLMTLCEALDIDPAELLAVAERAPRRVLRLDATQEAFFLERPETFHFFRALLDHGLDVAALEARHGLDRASSRVYLGELSRLDLVELLPDDRVRLASPGPWSLQMGSALGEVVVGGVQRALLAMAQARHAEHGAEQELGLARLRLTRAGMMELKAEMRALLERYADRARREALVHAVEELVEVGAMTVMAPFAFGEAVEIPPRLAAHQ